MKTEKCPSDELALTNRAAVCPQDFDQKTRHIVVKTSPLHTYTFTIQPDRSVSSNFVAFSGPQRKWASLSLKQNIEVIPYAANPNRDYVGQIVLECDFLVKNKSTTEPFDTDRMAAEFAMQFPSQAFTVGQPLAFALPDKQKFKLQLSVKELEGLNMTQVEGQPPRQLQTGVTVPNTVVIFDKAQESPVNLTGKAKTKSSFKSIINPEWNFSEMGIGGLDNEFSAIFRRAFASRVFPADWVEQMGLKHCRGILLFGPPGTGKTLMARQIGKMLNAREPKIINGPQILDKYVGESEANIRKLFAEAEEEEKRCGIHSGLHIIIFDEIDAICKARGSVAGSTAVHDTVVNQLLAKIDGVEQLNNILVIGMTNRKDMIDEALLRPGRLEVQVEISLPDEHGRVQILDIHTNRLRENDKLARDVSIPELAANTKNFSGAEIEGLIRAATQTAMNKFIKARTKVEIDPDAIEKLQVTRADFVYSLTNDIKPAFGTSDEQFEKMLARGIINWGKPVQDVLSDGEDLVVQVKNEQAPLIVAVLLEGPPNSGKTALAARIAKDAGFPFIKVCTPSTMVGFHEAAKCQAIKKVFDDAYKSPLSCVIVDAIERLLDYGPIGPRYSNLVLQALMTLLTDLPPPKHKLFVIGTTSNREVLEDLKLIPCFTSGVIRTRNLRTRDELISALDGLSAFSSSELGYIASKVGENSLNCGIKQLLNLVGRTKQIEEKYRASKFVSLLEEHGGLHGAPLFT